MTAPGLSGKHRSGNRRKPKFFQNIVVKKCCYWFLFSGIFDALFLFQIFFWPVEKSCIVFIAYSSLLFITETFGAEQPPRSGVCGVGLAECPYLQTEQNLGGKSHEADLFVCHFHSTHCVGGQSVSIAGHLQCVHPQTFVND